MHLLGRASHISAGHPPNNDNDDDLDYDIDDDIDNDLDDDIDGTLLCHLVQLLPQYEACIQ